jgi:F420-dependent oxidoreductase-like protein
MDLAVGLGYWGSGSDAADQVTLAKEADRLGYKVVWIAESYGSDAVTIMTWVAAHTERIGVGSSILQMPARKPTATAMTAATLDILSSGRVFLGLGLSGPQVSEGWYGVRYGDPLGRTREYVEILRRALAREVVEFHGRHYDLPLPQGPGKALKLIIHPRRVIPIYLAAIGPKNTALAGEIADGWLPAFFMPEHMKMFRSWLEEGAGRAGRALEDIDVCAGAGVAITGSRAEARDAFRPGIALYVGGMGSREKNFYNQLATRYGYGKEAKEIQDLYLSGQRAEAIAAVPDELVDSTNLIGSREEVRDRLEVYKDAGVGTLTVSPRGRDQDERLSVLRVMAELVL